MLTHFSCVQFFAIPWSVAQQAPLSMGFSRQEHWSENYQRNANQNHNEVPSHASQMDANKKSTNNKCWRGCGEKGTLWHCWWECKLVQPLWRTVWRFLKTLEIELSHDPPIPLLGIHTKELKETRVPQCSLQHCLQ